MKEKEKTFVLSICLDLKLSYATEVTAKPYPIGYVIAQFQKFEGRRGNAREHVVRFLDSIGALAHDVDLCMTKFSVSLSDRSYT